MSKAHPPELKKFMDKKLSLKLNGGRHVQGILRGFDPFMNLVIDECVEMATSGQQNNIGMVFCLEFPIFLSKLYPIFKTQLKCHLQKSYFFQLPSW
nr:small nuclear ribonucleoprotein G isoform X1 [Kogia breviceps]